MEKRRVLWGAGEVCERYLEDNKETEIAFIIDNDFQKSGTLFHGIPVLHPSKIKEWTCYKIIIVLNKKNLAVVADQLEQYGFREWTDFEVWIPNHKLITDISFEAVKNSLAEIVFGSDEEMEFEIPFYNRAEYEKIVKDGKAIIFEEYLDKIYSKLPNQTGIYKGFCEGCKKEVYFEQAINDTLKQNWREGVVCPRCGCNSRMRYVLERVLRECCGSENKKIFVYEKITFFYQTLLKYIPNLIGSEYLGEDKVSGRYYEGIRHEDAMNLSFSSNSIDMMISMDVFEHVADYDRVFSEVYRVLKRGGKLLATVPLNREKDITESRAKIETDGNIVYLKEPEYHGDPLSEKGSLVFHEYGWDLLDVLRSKGFSKVRCIAYFSVRKAYFEYSGNLPFVIEAVK